MHEADLHHDNAFITLTYDKIEQPSLHHPDFQKFMKKLRKRIGKVRFYMCGEYGENQEDKLLNKKHIGLGRKHFHAIIFGTGFPDRYPFKKSPSGEMLYRSETLEKCWDKGFSTTADVTFQSAAYVARYILKKQTGIKAEEHYIIPNEFGEVTPASYVEPEYTQMSRMPGIGNEWFKKYHPDIFPHDECIVYTPKGPRRVKTPRYYTKLLEKQDPILHEKIKIDRKAAAEVHSQNNTRKRLATREYITEQKLNQLRRDKQ